MDNYIAHILVVDDDDGIRSLVKKYLNENNYIVTTAANAEEAFEKIEVIEFDLIILDIMMPGKSGLDFIEENRKKLETSIIFDLLLPEGLNLCTVTLVFTSCLVKDSNSDCSAADLIPIELVFTIFAAIFSLGSWNTCALGEGEQCRFLRRTN